MGELLKYPSICILVRMSFYHLTNMYVESKMWTYKLKMCILLKKITNMKTLKFVYTHLTIYHLILSQFEFQHICKIVAI
jgi:hypothetical protein